MLPLAFSLSLILLDRFFLDHVQRISLLLELQWLTNFVFWLSIGFIQNLNGCCLRALWINCLFVFYGRVCAVEVYNRVADCYMLVGIGWLIWETSYLLNLSHSELLFLKDICSITIHTVWHRGISDAMVASGLLVTRYGERRSISTILNHKAVVLLRLHHKDLFLWQIVVFMWGFTAQGEAKRAWFRVLHFRPDRHLRQSKVRHSTAFDVFTLRRVFVFSHLHITRVLRVIYLILNRVVIFESLVRHLVGQRLAASDSVSQVVQETLNDLIFLWSESCVLAVQNRARVLQIHQWAFAEL